MSTIRVTHPHRRQCNHQRKGDRGEACLWAAGPAQIDQILAIVRQCRHVVRGLQVTDIEDLIGRRTSKREKANVPAVVMVRGDSAKDTSIQKAIIRDLSESGARLWLQSPVYEGSARLSWSGQAKEGEIKWTNGEHAGLKFTEPDKQADTAG